MYKLYYAPGTCSTAVHVAIHECNVQDNTELHKIDLAGGQGQTPDYLKINPRGQVPVLSDGDLTIREGAAILIYLLEKENSPLLPKSGAARARALEWLMFCNASLHPAYARIFFLKKNNVSDGPLVEAAITALNKMWADVEQQLAAQPYLCGAEISIADILLTVIANWSMRMPKPITLGPNVKKLLKNVISRPAYQKVMAEEQVEYKAAA